MKQVLAKKVFRTGLQKLLYDRTENQYYVSIENRTYYSIHAISHEKAQIWKDRLR